MLHLISLFLVFLATLILVSGVSFPGVDPGIGALLLAALVLAGAGAFRPDGSPRWSAAAAALSAVVLCFHLALVLGWIR